MSYDFTVRTPGNTPAAGAEASGRSSSPTPLGVERTVLYGTDIRRCSVPQETLFHGDYQVAFKNRQGQGFGLNRELLSKHLLLLGGIGCGKTNVFNFIIESLQKRMSDNDVMIIFDTKGDFKGKFYDQRNPAHWLIGNDAQYRNISRSWNIFDEMKTSAGTFHQESELIAKEIGKQLFIGRESPSQPFFSQAAADLVTKVLIHLMRMAARTHTENQLNTDIFVRFLQTATRKTYYDMITNPYNKDFASAESYLGKPEDKMTPQALGILGYINAMLNDLFIGVFAERSSVGSCSMRQIVREKGRRVLFVEYDLSVGETLGPMYRLIFDLALKEALGGRNANRGNVYLIIDEFKLLPNLQHIDDALNFGRSLGVKVIAGLQSINQLYESYGENRGKVLASGFMNCFCFQTFDLDSRKFIMERFGEKYENLAMTSRSNPVSVQRNGYVVEDWNILELGVGQAYINLVGYQPFLFQFAKYEEPHAVL